MGRTKGSKNKKTLAKEALEQNSPNIPDNEISKTWNETGTNNQTDQAGKIQDVKNEFDNINIDKQLKEESKQQKRSSYKSKRVREQEFQQSISGVGSFALNIIIKRLPNPVPLSPEESKNFDTMFSKVAYKYSNLLGDYQEEVALISITAMIIFPRMQKVKQVEKND